MGKLERGTRVLIVDDVITFGSTLANLRGWIEKQGAKVVGATTLAAGFGATKLVFPHQYTSAYWKNFLFKLKRSRMSWDLQPPVSPTAKRDFFAASNQTRPGH
jgi:hypoxanthine phosphoribosyltransferase